ncbi:hypothetical protein quinque_008102 [Culex quinquefasciatus]
MRLAYVCGAEIFRQNYTRNNRRLVLLYADFTLYLVISSWCLTVLWGQLLDVIFCVVTIGGAVQAFAKISSYINPTIYELHLKNMDNFKTFGNITSELLHDILEKHIQHTENLSDLDNALKNGIYINFGSLITQTVFSFYVIATADEIWYTGLAIVTASAVQLFTACLMGTLLSSKVSEFVLCTELIL